MTSNPKILGFAGSLREGSFNKMLVKTACAGAEKAGAEVTFIDLADFPLPVFAEDLERAEGLPENAVNLKKIFRSHHGVLIASPEYNSSISAALKNVIDWVSRPEPDRPPLDCFAGKVAGIMSAAAGGLGGMRGLPHLREILQNIQMIVVPSMVAIPIAHQAFNDDGTLKDERKAAAVEDLGRTVTEIAAKLNA
ncbi:MAG: NAD(P)H-dependent oxidoreductase [Phycisphaerales bacterium]|nr:MAG: NAD(P)H-dependent oxidoreductase [Phycisphaerales bacterium]